MHLLCFVLHTTAEEAISTETFIAGNQLGLLRDLQLCLWTVMEINKAAWNENLPFLCGVRTFQITKKYRKYELSLLVLREVTSHFWIFLNFYKYLIYKLVQISGSLIKQCLSALCSCSQRWHALLWGYSTSIINEMAQYLPWIADNYSAGQTIPFLSNAIRYWGFRARHLAKSWAIFM
jgi:hypothetical protein